MICCHSLIYDTVQILSNYDLHDFDLLCFKVLRLLLQIFNALHALCLYCTLSLHLNGRCVYYDLENII
jgi:hypothetical protein